MDHNTDDRVPRQTEKQPSYRWVWVIFSLVLIALLAYQLLGTSPKTVPPPEPPVLLEPEPPLVEQPPAVAQPVAPDFEAPIQEQKPKVPPVAKEPVESQQASLPELDASDPVVRELAEEVAVPPVIDQLFVPEELVRKITVFVDALSKGDVMKKDVGSLAPKGKFIADKVSDKVYTLNPDSYQRYDAFTTAFVELNTKALVSAYQRIEPLFDEAYDELGYPDGRFRDALTKAMRLLKQTPILDEEIQLIRPSVMYKFADAELEALSAAQKQLIRMGPDNSRKILAKLAEIEAALE